MDRLIVNDIMLHIFSYLKFNDIFNGVLYVNKRWNAIINIFLKDKRNFKCKFGIKQECYDYHIPGDYEEYIEYEYLSDIIRAQSYRCARCIKHNIIICQCNRNTTVKTFHIKVFNNFTISRVLFDIYDRKNGKHSSMHYLYFGLRPKKNKIKHNIKYVRMENGKKIYPNCYTDQLDYITFNDEKYYFETHSMFRYKEILSLLDDEIPLYSGYYSDCEEIFTIYGKEYILDQRVQLYVK